MASFTVSYDHRIWIQVPVGFPTESGQSRERWVGDEADQQRELGYKETRRTGTLDKYFERLLDAANMALANVSHDSIWALVHPGAPNFLMAAIDIREAEGRLEDLVTDVAARRPDEYEPATVEPAEFGNLGDGAEIVRHDFDEARKVCGSVALLCRSRGRDVLLSSQSYDLVALRWALPAMHELMSGVQFVEE